MTNCISSIGFALDPTSSPSFLLDWELTKLCNLDCSYCGTSIEFGGHNNNTKHPPLDECLKSIDFMYEYVSLYMQHKKPTQRKVVLNIYGGESLFHPDIVEILEQVRQRYEPYKDQWHLTVTCTTNGVVGPNLWSRIVPLIDNFTLSYHTESLPKQKQQYKDNVLYLKSLGKPFRCVVMMHNDKDLWTDSMSAVDWCKEHNVPYTAKPFDNTYQEMSYTKEQFKNLKTIWITKVPASKQQEYAQMLEDVGNEDSVNSINQGRSCCGGRKLSLNSDLKSSVTFVPKQGFEGWYCSVNWFFLYVQQCTGYVYINRDCRTSTNTNRVEPLGDLRLANRMLEQLKKQLDTNTMPVIQCVKDTCLCGFCAPKAETRSEFDALIRRHVITEVIVRDE
jgi:pyruvate-formate lyase-activating enzyme